MAVEGMKAKIFNIKRFKHEKYTNLTFPKKCIFRLAWNLFGFAGRRRAFPWFEFG